jgi:hypothetical protein
MICCSPQRRINNWSEQPEVHSVWNKFRIYLAILGLGTLGLLAYFWYEGGHSQPQIALLFWIICKIFTWLIAPLFNFCNPPNDKNDCVQVGYALYIVFGLMALGELGMGLFLWQIYTPTIDPHRWLSVFFIIMALVDGINISCFFIFNCQMEAQKLPEPPALQSVQIMGGDNAPIGEVEKEIPTKPDNPNITQHSYYTTCSICTEQFKEGDNVKELICKHIYHPTCIELWLKSHDICPTCMSQV